MTVSPQTSYTACYASSSESSRNLHDRWATARAEHEAADRATPANDPIGDAPGSSSSRPDVSDVETTTVTLAAEMIEDVWSTMDIRWLAWWTDTAILAVHGVGVVDRFRAAATSPQWLLQPHQVAMVRRLSSAENDGSTALPEKPLVSQIAEPRGTKR